MSREELNFLELDIQTERIEKILDKFLKLSENVSIELRNIWIYKLFWENHIIEITEYLYLYKLINVNERNSIYDGSLDIPECIFLLLEKLIFWWYFTEIHEDSADVSCNSLIYEYAWNTYTRLAEDLWKKTKVNPYWSKVILLLENKKLDTKNTVQKILERENDWEYDEYIEEMDNPFFIHLIKWVQILENLGTQWWELMDYEVDELIYMATEYDVLNPDQAQNFIDMLDTNISIKAQIIFQIFQIFFDSSFMDDIEIDEDDRILLKWQISRHLFALNMLASTWDFRL